MLFCDQATIARQFNVEELAHKYVVVVELYAADESLIILILQYDVLGINMIHKFPDAQYCGIVYMVTRYAGVMNVLDTYLKYTYFSHIQHHLHRCCGGSAD